MSERGPIGRDGATGAEGRAGTTGRDGGEGHAGEQGLQGGVGERGERGVTGDQGLQGIQGVRGPAGSRNAAAAFLILMSFAFFGFVAVDRQAKDANMSVRAECERTNVLRENQGKALQDQIKATRRSLERPLGSLEKFRKEIKDGLRLREEAVERLRKSVDDYPTEGRPFAINCIAAHP